MAPQHPGTSPNPPPPQGLAQFQRMAVECRQLAADEALLRAATPDQQEERQALLARTARLRLRSRAAVVPPRAGGCWF